MTKQISEAYCAYHIQDEELYINSCGSTPDKAWENLYSIGNFDEKDFEVFKVELHWEVPNWVGVVVNSTMDKPQVEDMFAYWDDPDYVEGNIIVGKTK